MLFLSKIAPLFRFLFLNILESHVLHSRVVYGLKRVIQQVCVFLEIETNYTCVLLWRAWHMHIRFTYYYRRIIICDQDAYDIADLRSCDV